MNPNSLDVVVTNRCADACAETFGLVDREAARRWLLEIISSRGAVVDQLPAPMAGRRSRSGWFLLADRLVALPLALDTDASGRQQWIATNCLAVPRHDRAIDPTALNGPALLAHVRLTTHAIERFQQRGGGHPDLEHARAQLTHILTPHSPCQPPITGVVALARARRLLPNRRRPRRMVPADTPRRTDIRRHHLHAPGNAAVRAGLGRLGRDVPDRRAAAPIRQPTAPNPAVRVDETGCPVVAPATPGTAEPVGHVVADPR
ncbi:hypothetical protein ABIA39_009071 [Nocardia sp. GAS34]|uniref:hypothetical protein n=1 Tax=unclassified Nocardia TaxID=2637762 RepID=UPI003D1C9B6E